MELVVIVIVFLLLFGGRKLGDLGKGLGEGIKHFKTAIKDDDKDDKNKP
jgi:sec-independent protein translocase protein TatA